MKRKTLKKNECVHKKMNLMGGKKKFIWSLVEFRMDSV